MELINLQPVKSRQRNLFKLLADESTYKPTSYFSGVLAVSHKTIYNDIDVLNEEMKRYELSIVKKPRNGLMLKGKEANKECFLQYLMESGDDEFIFSPKNRRMEIVRLLMIEANEISLNALEEKFYVTVASLRTDIENLQNFLKPFHISISTNKTIVCIEGSESSIQKALKHYILDMIKDEDSYITMMDYAPLQQLLDQLFDEAVNMMVKDTLNHLVETSKRRISDYYVRSLYVILLILVSRVCKNFHITKQEVISEDISYLEPYMIAIEITETFEKQCGIHFLEEDTRYLSQQLFAHGIEPVLRSVSVQNPYTEIVNKMIISMSHLLETDLTDDEKLKDSLLFHIPPMIYRLRRKIKVSNPLLREIKNQYIVLFSLTWYVAAELEQTYDVLLDDDEISFLFIYFQVSLEKRHGVHFKNIIIVCPIGLATSELIFTRVRQILPTRDNLCTMTVQELYNSDLTNVDFVISTTKLKDIEPTVIYVSPLVNNEDIDHITQHYAKLNNQINTFQQYTSNGCKELKDYLSEDSTYCQLSFHNKKECLDYLIQEYEDKGLVDENFKASIFEREELGDTSLYTGVAIPHALPDTVKESRISIATLKEKIQWGVNEVNIVMVIGIAKQDLDCIKEVLSKLLSIVEEKEIIDGMTNAKSKQELLKVLGNAL